MYISLDILIEEWPAIRISVHTSQPDAPSLVRNVWRKLYSTKGRAFEVFKAVRCCFLTLEWSMCRVFDIQQPKIAPIPICQYDPTLIRPAIRFRSWLSLVIRGFGRRCAGNVQTSRRRGIVPRSKDCSGSRLTFPLRRPDDHFHRFAVRLF